MRSIYPRIEAKDRTGEVLSSESELRFKKSPKVHLIDAPIVEISSTFIRKH
jgi:nicotinate-nucleotide adenylyltransferase